jgi:hypothetical protein
MVIAMRNGIEKMRIEKPRDINESKTSWERYD